MYDFMSLNPSGEATDELIVRMQRQSTKHSTLPTYSLQFYR